MKNTISYIVWQEGDQFVSQCLNYDIASSGASRDEAILGLREALELYLEDDSTPVSHSEYIPVSDIMIGQYA